MIVDKFSAAFEREIESKPLNNIMFFGGFAVLTFLIIFVFGIRPTVLALAQNTKYKSELEAIKSRMETKLEQIQRGEVDLEALQLGIASLNLAIPNDIFMQEFLQELVIESAKAGFAVTRVKQADLLGDTIPVDVELEGALGRVGEVLTAMENMKRFVNVEDIRLNVDEGTARLSLKAKIYKI